MALKNTETSVTSSGELQINRIMQMNLRISFLLLQRRKPLITFADE